MKHIKFSTILLLLLITSPAPAQISLTYTGNMGVLLSTDDHTILIDGLHEFYQPAYQNPSVEMIEDLLTPGGNYPVPDIALVTHHHRDHFSAKLLDQFSTITVIGPAQVTGALVRHNQPSVLTVPYGGYQVHQHLIEGVSIKAFRMDHVNSARHREVQNIGYIIELGGYSILHTGDSDWYEKMFENLRGVIEVDIAILPVWMVLQGRSEALIHAYLKPQYLVVTHIDPRNAQDTTKEIRKKFPDSLALIHLGETHTF